MTIQDKFLRPENHSDGVDHYFIHLNDGPSAFSGAENKYVKVDSTASGLEFASIEHGDLGGLMDDDHPQYVAVNGSRGFNSTVSGVYPTEDYHLATKEYVNQEIVAVSGALGISAEEKWIWQIKLAKLRPSLLQKASSNFTPSGYDVYPIIAHNWRAGTSAEYEHGAGYPQTIVIKSGTVVALESDGWMFYIKSTDAHSISDPVQSDNPKREYYKRLQYIQNNNYQYITAWMGAGGWNTQAVNPGTYGSLLIGYTFDNNREFTIFNNAMDKHVYHGNLQTDGYLNKGFARHEDKFFVPFDETLKFDVRSGNYPSGGGIYTVKYIDVPNWW